MQTKLTVLTTSILATAVACSPGNPVIEETGDATDWVFDCQGNNDGVIEADELPWATGVSVPYRVNRADSTVSVQPAGELIDGVTLWDYTQAPCDQAVEFDLVDPEDYWFAEHFTDASYAVPLFAEDPDLLAVFSVAGDDFTMLGLASREQDPSAGQTLLVYEEPVQVYQFPLELGSAWSASSTFRDAVIYGVPNAGEESYAFEADAIGTLVLPGFTMDNVIRLRVEVEQSFAVSTGDNPIVSVRHLYLRECFGEIVRITSVPGETEIEFTEAAELRVFDVEG
jgi:hypothetical protein